MFSVDHMFRKTLMTLRLLISDALWSKIEPVLRELKHAAGSPPKLSDRMFIEAVLYQARTGIPWRDLPDEFGDWNAVYHRFRRWEKRELWKRLWQRFQSIDDEQLKELFIDSTIVRAHQHAAGASKKTVDNKPRLWAALGADCPPSCTTRGLHRRTHRRIVRAEWGRASRRDGVRGGVGGGAGGTWGDGCGDGQGV